MVDSRRGVGMLSLPLLLGVIGAALVVWFWQNSLGAREHANRAALDACTRMQLQFLDGTVAFARLGLARNDRGHLCLRRTYIFDYTATSIERRQGFVVLLGTRVESIGFAPDDQQRHSVTRLPDGTDKSSTIDHETSNVLDLEEWRRRHQRKPPPNRSSSPNDNAPSDNGW